MTNEKLFEYMKELAEFLPQESKEYLIQDNYSIRIITKDYKDAVINEYETRLEHYRLYSNFSIEELLEFLPENIEFKILRVNAVHRKEYLFIPVKINYKDEIRYSGESLRECIIKAIIELNKMGKLKI